LLDHDAALAADLSEASYGLLIERLRRSEERFRLLVEGVVDCALYMLDAGGHVTTWNSGAELIKGFTAKEIVGKHFSAFFTPEDIATGHPMRELESARTSGRFAEEGWRVRKDGSRFWASVVVTPIRDAQGTLLGFAKVTRDLTSQRLAEQTAQELSALEKARAVSEGIEATLRVEHERYRALSRRLEVILEGVVDAITVQDRSGRLLFANPAAARISGFSSVAAMLSATPAEILGSFDIFDERGLPFPPADLPGRRVLAGSDSAVSIMRVVERATRRSRWVSVRASAVLDTDGEPELSVNIWHDITEERRREERERYVASATATLSASLDYERMPRELASVLVPGLADWCAVHLLEGDTLESAAVAHVDPARVTLATEYQRRYPPNPQHQRGVWNVLRTGRSELYEHISDELLAGGARDAEQLEVLRAVGMQSVMIVPIRGRAGNVGTISLVSTDADRRYDAFALELAEELARRAGASIENARLYAAEKKARSQLELLARAGEAFSGALEYEEILRSVVSIALPSLGDFAIFDVVEGSRVRRVAAAHDAPELEPMLESTTWMRSEPREKNLCALSTGTAGAHAAIDDAWRQAVATTPEHLELLRRVSLGSMLTVPLRVRGDVLGALTLCFGSSGRHHTVDDLTLAEELARRAAVAVVQARLYDDAQSARKRAEEASRIKDEFLATVSHELRTPLNAIVGWSSLLRDRAVEPSVTKGIEVIHRNAHAQAKIIDDILDVSRIITGKLRLELKPADLIAIVHDAIEVVRPSASAKRISLEVAPVTEPFLLVADPERLQQVVWNMLSNAVKFTSEGGRVRVLVERDGASLSLTVTDTGNGIEPEFLPYVFDRFKQADGSTTRRVGGLGLGLSIVRHIVELHGGRVAAKSDGPGKGASFTMTLPVRAVLPGREDIGALAAHTGELAVRHAGPSLAGLRVLVVDDEIDARDLLRVVLAEAGAVVDVAASAEEGVQLFHRAPPHVIVSDVGMPDEDGYTFMRRIRALEPELAGRTPSIALTAYTRGEDKTKALAVGFTIHMAKPVNPDDLVAAVANLARFSRRADSS
jgi:PAS domain S-box-containing protein